MKVDTRILSVFAFGLLVGAPALGCNQHPPDVSHERWLAQIQQWNKEYDVKQAAKATAQAEKREAGAGRERGRRNADDPAPMAGRRGSDDPQVRSVGRQPQSLPAAPAAAAPTAPSDDRRARRYR